MGRSERAVILSYHRVARASLDPFALCIAPEDFAEQLQLLRARFRVMPLDELVAAAAAGALPPRAVAITLDDGTVDNLEAAEQIVAASMSATLFVTSGGLHAPTEPWWERLTRALADDLPRLRETHGRLLPLPAAERDAEIARLRAARGLDAAPRAAYRLLTATEVRRLSLRPGVTIGAHGADHLFLPAQPRDGQRRELELSRSLLEATIARPVLSFAYPFGAHSPTTVELTRAAGFGIAVTTVEGLVQAGADPLLLPRLAAPPDAGSLERALTAALDRDGAA